MVMQKYHRNDVWSDSNFSGIAALSLELIGTTKDAARVCEGRAFHLITQ